MFELLHFPYQNFLLKQMCHNNCTLTSTNIFFLQSVQATIPSPQLTQTLNIAQPRELAKSMLAGGRVL